MSEAAGLRGTSARGQSIGERFRRSWLGPRQPYWGVLLVVPILIFFLIFKFWPLLQAIRLSLYDADPLKKVETFLGARNFLDLASDPLFLRSLVTTTTYVVGTVVPIMVLSLVLALLLHTGLRGTPLFRTLIFLPVIVPIIIVPILWRFLFHPYGLVNEGLGLFGIAGPNWLSDSDIVVGALIIPTDWRFIPLYALIYLAGLQSIAEDYYDAAKVDGASVINRFRWITLPLLKPTTVVVLIASVTFTAKSIVLPLVMTEGGPNNASTTLSLFIYQNGFAFFNLGYASAASVVLLIVVVTFTIATLRLFRTDD